MACDPFAAVVAKMEAGQSEEARQILRELTQRRLGLSGGHREAGILAERLGLLGIAEREFNLALRDDPNDAESLGRLVALAEEKGAVERAANLLERLFDLTGNPEVAARLAAYYQELGAGPRLEKLKERCKTKGIRLPREDHAPEALEVPEPVIPPEGDLIRFLGLFGGREDVYARQWFSPAKGEGGYSPVRQPLTVRELRAHLLGEITLGVYPIRLDGTCLFCALDVDIRKEALAEARKSASLAQLVRDELAELTRKLWEEFEKLGMTPLVEDSGYKGRHFWFPLAAPEDAATLVALGRAVVGHLSGIVGERFALEWFPKASRPGSRGLGNLIKLPLGVHRRTGRRSVFLDRKLQPVANPFLFLREAPRLTREVILAVLDRQRLQEPEPLPEPPEEPAVPPAVPIVPPKPLWTAEHFQTHPQFRALLSGCEVLKRLVEQATEERRLSYDEAMVIVHTFGYVQDGVVAANHIFRLVPGLNPNVQLKSPLRGNPMSCVKIRARIPHITSRCRCNCEFPAASDHYPSPVLHLRGVPPELSEKTPAVQELFELYVRLGNKIEQLVAERQEVHRRLVEALKNEPHGLVELPNGLLQLQTKDGVDCVTFTPRGSHGEDRSDH
ncbi:MAG: CRISPR-associated primase-polymerase type A1 [Thermoanaerobaculum sp.]